MFQIGSKDLEDLDMGGPLLIAAVVGAIHLVVSVRNLTRHITQQPS